MKSIFKSNKGTILDILPLGIIIFSFALSIIFSYSLYNQMLGTGFLNQTAQSQQIGSIILPQFKVFDNLFIAAIVGLSITSIIAAARVRTSPLFFFISLVLYTIVLIISYVINQTYQSLASNSSLVASVSAFPKLNFIMNNFLLFMMIMGTLITIALYSTRGQESFT